MRPLFDGTGRWKGILVFSFDFFGRLRTLAGCSQMTRLSTSPTNRFAACYDDRASLDELPFEENIHEVGNGIEGWCIGHYFEFPFPTFNIGGVVHYLTKL